MKEAAKQISPFVTSIVLLCSGWVDHDTVIEAETFGKNSYLLDIFFFTVTNLNFPKRYSRFE